jgi:hypothetical protein
MSEYASVKTSFRDQEALVAALMALEGCTKDQIEIHAEPQPLIGYVKQFNEGYRIMDTGQKAHVILRRGHVRTHGVANDIGFIRMPDGTYKALISDAGVPGNRYYRDHWHGQAGQSWEGAFKQNYALAVIQAQARRMGQRVEFRRENGKIVGQVVGYR